VDHVHKGLARASARQNHTTSPSVSMPLVCRHIHVHRIPLHVRDDRDTPLAGAELGKQTSISEKEK
jgi:hypothetical protein